MYTPVNPSLTIQKWGLRGSKLYGHVFVMKAKGGNQKLSDENVMGHSSLVEPTFCQYKSFLDETNATNTLTVILSLGVFCESAKWLLRFIFVLNVIRKTHIFKYIENFTTKKGNFSDKKSDIFHIAARSIGCEYSLQPPRRVDSNEYPQSM